MATVIRGSDNFDTADNATQTELDSGLSGKLDSGAGKVLKVSNFYSQSTQTLTGTTETTLSGWDFTVTKVKSDSRLICFAKIYCYYSSSPTYWWIKAFANGSLVTSSAGGFQSSVLTHNAKQYSFLEGAHQMYNGQFYDDTNASSVNFTFTADQNVSGNLVFWGSGRHEFTFIEVEK